MTMSRTMPAVLDIRNGGRQPLLFSEAEMERRMRGLRERMATHGLDAVLFTSYHNICYFSQYLPVRFGRNYALIVDRERSVLVASSIDYGQPRRRAWCDDVVSYTDWERENFFRALRSVLPTQCRMGVEEDDMQLALADTLRDRMPAVETVAFSEPVMRQRMIKSEEEIAHIASMCEIANIGGRACIEAVRPGIAEYEVAMEGTSAMMRAIAERWPHLELRDSWIWFQSGINTDGAHNPLTTRRLRSGDILSLNCFPMVGGYYTALERTLFLGELPQARRRVWETNCRVFEKGRELLRPGARCSDIARALDEIYAAEGLLDYRTFGYGHSFGVLCHYYGREAGLELREDVDTILEPGMVVSMEPMVALPEGHPAAGGYRDHDVLVITPEGNRNLTDFPYGPDQLVIGL